MRKEEAMKDLLMIALLVLLAVPAVTWWLENRDPDRWEAAKLADRCRRDQAQRAPHRRTYGQTIKPPLLEQRRQPKGQM